MLLSMTGFGEAHHQSDAINVSLELRALNNRYLKVSLRATEPYHLLEPEFEKVQSVADLCGWSLSTARRRLEAAETRVAAKLNAVPHHARSQP